MVIRITVTMKNNDKFIATLDVGSLEQARNKILERPHLELNWDTSFAIISMNEILSVIVEDIGGSA